MYSFRDMQIKRVLPGSDGRFVFATYGDWQYEYNFFISEEGRIKGRTSVDHWVDLSEDAGEIIERKFKEYMEQEEVA